MLHATPQVQNNRRHGLVMLDNGVKRSVWHTEGHASVHAGLLCHCERAQCKKLTTGIMHVCGSLMHTQGHCQMCSLCTGSLPWSCMRALTCTCANRCTGLCTASCHQHATLSCAKRRTEACSNNRMAGGLMWHDVQAARGGEGGPAGLGVAARAGGAIGL